MELLRIRSRTLLSTSLAVLGLSLAVVGGFNLLSTSLAVDPVLLFYRQIDLGVTIVERDPLRVIHNSDFLLIGLGLVVAYVGVGY